MNKFHIHLTDDQSWRLESKKYPELTKTGATRDATPVLWHRDQLDGKPYGPYFYTIEQMKELIIYAHQRSITIVPELEMPGHALAALACFPHLSCTGGPFRPRCFWGIEEDVWCAGNDETIKFLETIVDEFLEIFDSEFFHVGGDECYKTRWKECPKCQKRIKDNNLKDEDQLQSWVIQHFANYLKAKGRRLIGWDEILEGGIAEGAAVMSWRGTSGGETAARAGHEVVMAPETHVYLDRCQFPVKEQGEYLRPGNTLFHVYGYDPQGGIEEQFKKFVIGCQGNMWSEYVPDRADLEYKLFPRTLALAEIAWSRLDKKDWSHFLAKLVQKGYPFFEITGLRPCPINLGPQHSWDAPATGKFETVEWKFPGNVGGPQEYGAGFVRTSGAAIKVKNVQLKFGGKVVAEDKSERRVEKDAGTFVLTTTEAAGEAEVTLMAEICAEGKPSAGRIYLYPM
jgi:hexosaminidase